MSRRRATLALVTAMFALGLVAIGPPASATVIGVNCATQHLQPKLDAAPAGSTVLVKGTCIGPFTIDSNVTIKGNPTATLDGNDSGSTLTINGAHTIHLVGLTITGGENTSGAGIDREGGGVLTLVKVKVLDNLATGLAAAKGGGILSTAGSLSLTASTVSGNRALAQDPAATDAEGGGIWAAGPVTLLNSTVSANRATAYSFGDTASGGGGGIWVEGAALTVTGSHVDGNRVVGVGTHGVETAGGGVDLAGGTAHLTITGSTVSANIVTANEVVGSQSAAASGGGVQANVDTATITGTKVVGDRVVGTSAGGDAFATGAGIAITVTTKLTMTQSKVTGPRATANAGDGASANGGGLAVNGPTHVATSVFSGARLLAHGQAGPAAANGGGIEASGPLTLDRSTVDRNKLTATSDSNTAFASGGGVVVSTAIVVASSTISRNTMASNAESSIAQTIGAGITLNGQFEAGSITNSTITGNAASSTLEAGTGTSRSLGGGIESNEMTLDVVASTIAHNFVGVTGGSSLDVGGGGVQVAAGTTTLRGTVLALNQAEVGPDCVGTVASFGNNLVQTTSGCTFGNTPSDRLHLDPKLAALSNNGGPTKTLALQAGSPAINWIPAGQCAAPKDQRGVSRPQGPKCDIGAFEREP